MKTDVEFPLKQAILAYENTYIPEHELVGDEHPLRFDDYACMYWGIPKNVAQQYIAENFI